MKTTEDRVFDLLEATGLNWSVALKPLITQEGLPTKSVGIFRGDKWLGTTGLQYTPLQNSELAMTIVQASENVNVEVHRGGELNGGKKVYLQASLTEVVIGASEVKRWITALNSHDGTTCIGFGSSNTVVICQNTFYRAYKEVERFRHTPTAIERIEKAIKDMRTALHLDEQLITNFKQMNATTLTDELVDRVMRKMFKVSENLDLEPLSERKKNTLISFSDGLKTEIKTHGNNLWALFNGVTRYTNHIQPKDDKSKESSIMLGAGYRLSNMSFNEIMSYIEEHSEVELVPVN